MELKLLPTSADSLECVTERLCVLATQLHVMVSCNFGGAELTARPGEDAHRLRAQFHTHNSNTSSSAAAKEWDLSAQLQKKIKDAKDEQYRQENAEKRF